MEEIREECNSVIEEICQTYGYESSDKQDSDSLKTVLKKAVFAMCKNAEKEDRQLLYQMLRHTPIIVIEDIDEEQYKNLIETYIGNPNPNVINVEGSVLGEYGKQLGKGAYVSEPIIDNDLNVVGKKSFIYVPKAQGKTKKIYSSDINVAYLIHELGHAWHSEKDQFTITENGMLQERIGTARIIYSLTKTDDGKIIKKQEKVSDLIIEEGANTVDEENYMSDYLGISLEELKDEYKSTLVSSNYQGYIAEFVRYMMQELGKKEFEKWRMNGDTESKAKIEALIQRTGYWKNSIIQNLDSEDYRKKREIIQTSGNRNKKIKDFFEEYEDIYFPQTQMSPLDTINNALSQYYNMKASSICYNMGIDDYAQLIKQISNETYPLVNQATLIKLKDDLKSSLGKVSLLELNEMANRVYEQEEFLKRTNQGERV